MMKRYITFKDYESICKIGKLWLERCNDVYLEDGSIYHHLPLIDPMGDPLEIKNFSMDNKFRKEFLKDMRAKVKVAVEGKECMIGKKEREKDENCRRRGLRQTDLLL